MDISLLLDPGFLSGLWEALGRPLARLLLAMCLGLLVANVIEALGWTRWLGKLSAPLVRLARLGTVSGASFSLAFVSPSAANALLAESHTAGQLSRKELVLANLFNSLPSYLVHLPTMLFMLWPVLGSPALAYVGLTLAAAVGRTLLTAWIGHWLLPAEGQGLSAVQPEASREQPSFRGACRKAWMRFRRRLPRLVLITVPIYIIMYLLQRYGVFQAAQDALSSGIPGLSFLKPEALGIILLSLAAEIGASLSAAGSALHMGGLTGPDVVIALLVGNILSTPMRTVRHQFPAYAGYYSPRLALYLIVLNQGLRALAMIAVTFLYWLGHFA